MSALLLALLRGEQVEVPPAVSAVPALSESVQSSIGTDEQRKKAKAEKKAAKKALQEERKKVKEAHWQNKVQHHLVWVEGVCAALREGYLNDSKDGASQALLLLSPVTIDGVEHEGLEIPRDAPKAKKLLSVKPGDRIELFVTRKSHGVPFTYPYYRIKFN